MYESDDARYLLLNLADRTHQPRNYFVGCKSLYNVAVASSASADR